MAPATGTALLVLVAFVLPGFVALLIGERTHVVRRERSPFELLLVATYYSVLSWGIIALASWPFHLNRDDLLRMWREDSLGQLAALALIPILVVPFLVAQVSRMWRRSERLRPWLLKLLRIHPGHATPAAWDALFSRKQPAMVRAILTDKRVVGGFYGSNSFAGYSEEGQDLLLEDSWILDEDDWFVEPAPKTSGVWLASGSIVALELYHPVYEQPAAKDTEAQGSGARSPEANDRASNPAAEAGQREEGEMTGPNKGKPSGVEERGHPPPAVTPQPSQPPPKPEQGKPK
jgi:hypothetical protein